MSSGIMRSLLYNRSYTFHLWCNALFIFYLFILFFLFIYFFFFLNLVIYLFFLTF